MNAPGVKAKSRAYFRASVATIERLAHQSEDRALLEAFDEGLSIAELARVDDRTSAGIHARLTRPGRVQGEGPQWRGRAANAVASATGGERTET